jgi:hypothetical protein
MTLEIPYKTEVIAPHLAKPGLRVMGPSSPRNYALPLLRSGAITRARFEAAGFILFENHRQSPFVASHDFTVGGQQEQFLHYDTDPAEDEEYSSFDDEHALWPEAASLRSDELATPRLTQTAIGDSLDSFQAIARLVGSGQLELSGSKTPRPLQRIKNVIQSWGLKKLLSKDRTDPLVNDLIEDLFGAHRVEEIFGDFPHVHQLVAAVNDVIYRHTWESHQLLVFDNHDMAHSRVHPNEWTSSHPLPTGFGDIHHQYFQWVDGGLVPGQIQREAEEIISIREPNSSALPQTG